MWYWYNIVPACMGIAGILMLSFGVWGILQWDQYSKLLANINLILEKIIYNLHDERR